MKVARHIADTIASVNAINPNHDTARDSEARSGGAKGKLKRCGSVAVVGVSAGACARCTRKARYAIGGNVDLFKETLCAVFGAVELAQKPRLVHRGSANGHKLLAVAGQHRFNVRINKAVELFAGHAGKVGACAGKRQEAFANKRGSAFAQVALYGLAGNGVNELLAVRLGNFLVPIQIRNAFNRVGLNANMPRVKRQRNFTFNNANLVATADSKAVDSFARIADNEFVGLAVALAFKLASKVFLGAVHKVACGFGKPYRDKLGKAVSLDCIRHR